jgi:hypothetical protein
MTAMTSRDLGRGARLRALIVAMEIAAEGPLAGRPPVAARNDACRLAKQSPSRAGRTRPPFFSGLMT